MFIQSPTAQDVFQSIPADLTSSYTSISIPYCGKLLREKTFANFAVLWLFTQVFSAKFGGVVSFGVSKRRIHESFLHDNHIFSPICRSFLLSCYI